MPTDALRVHLSTTTILKGWTSISPETCYQVACCRYHHPERMESISPGLRGTSYPGFTATDAGYPERVVSNSSAPPGGSVKMHPPITFGPKFKLHSVFARLYLEALENFPCCSCGFSPV